MPSWDQIGAWAVLAGLVVGVLIGRKLAKAKASNLRAEGGRAALSAHLSNVTNVVVGNDSRFLGLAADVSDDGASDHSAELLASYYRSLQPDRPVQLNGSTRDGLRLPRGPGVVPAVLPGRSAGVARAPMIDVSDDLTGSYVARSNTWGSGE